MDLTPKLSENTQRINKKLQVSKSQPKLRSIKVSTVDSETAEKED